MKAHARSSRKLSALETSADAMLKRMASAEVYAQDQSTAPEARVLAHKERESVLTGMPSKNKNA